MKYSISLAFLCFTLATQAQSLTVLQLEDSLFHYINPVDLIDELETAEQTTFSKEKREELYKVVKSEKASFWYQHPGATGVNMADILSLRASVASAIASLAHTPVHNHAHHHGHSHGHHHGIEDDKGLKKKGKGGNEGAVKIPNGPCVNMDFEACDWSGWETFQGSVNGVPFGYVNVVPSPTWNTYPNVNNSVQHYIVNGGNDPVVGFPMVNPDGGSCSAAIGDFTNSGYGAGSTHQEFLVDSTNMNFSYAYSVVLQNPSSHTPGEMPYFRVRMYDQAGLSIPCADFEVYAGDGNPAWQVTPNGTNYIVWQTVYVPLASYVGQNVKLEFIVGDCDLGGHYGYAYIDATCNINQITPSDTVVCAATPVTLWAPDGALSYLWSNGSTADSIIVTSPGTYTVDVQSVGGCSFTLSETIYQGSDFPVWFTTANECDGDTTQFFSPQANDTNNVVISWDFDSDGSIDFSGMGNPTFTYPDTGWYSVAFMAEDWIGCGGDTIIDFYVKPSPVADFTYTSACPNAILPFTDQSFAPGYPITNYNWDFDVNGVIDDFAQNPTSTFTTSGNNNVSLQVINSVGCQNTIEQPVHVYFEPTPQFTVAAECIDETSIFTDLSVANEGNLTQWEWSYGPNVFSSTSTASFLFPFEGFHATKLEVMNSVGCINDTIIDAVIWPKALVNFTTDSVCFGLVNQFLDQTTVSNINTTNNIADWSWVFEPSQTSTTQNPIHVYSAHGTYPTSLTATTDKGCISDTTLDVVIHPIPVASFTTADTAGCTDWCPQFTNLSTVATGLIDSYDWDFGDGASDNIQDPSHCYNNPTLAPMLFDVSLTVESDYGCVDDTTVNTLITVWPLPVADFEWGPEIIVEDWTDVSFTDLSDLPISWAWDFGDSNVDSIQNPYHVYDEAGDYPVSLNIVNQWGCVDSIEYIVTVLPDAAVWAPNAFTPDGDGTNETWTPVCYGCTEIELLIFNRWGELLFATNEVNRTWDGTYKGKLSEPGVYVYKIKAKDAQNKTHDLMGHITLVR